MERRRANQNFALILSIVFNTLIKLQFLITFLVPIPASFASKLSLSQFVK